MKNERETNATDPELSQVSSEKCSWETYSAQTFHCFFPQINQENFVEKKLFPVDV